MLLYFSGLTSCISMAYTVYKPKHLREISRVINFEGGMIFELKV